MTALLTKLQGEWAATELVTNGEPMRADWLAFGHRATDGNEMKVVFGGQVTAHAKMRFDETVLPIAVDYLNLSGAAKGKITLGIMDWVGDEVRFAIAGPGVPRPVSFDAPRRALHSVAGERSEREQSRRGIIAAARRSKLHPLAPFL